MPLIMTHGWPGSVVEFQNVLGPLSDPVSYGGDAADAFHVVCPTIPGYGYSAKPTSTGWGTENVARAWDDLMGQLGYEFYVAQGGDWGSIITTHIGAQNLRRCRAIHVNMPVVRPDPDSIDDLDETEKDAIAAYTYYQEHDSGYSRQQSTRPQSLGYGLADSPAGQAAWILEKYHRWMDCDGHPENVVSRDELLDNIMMYWLTNSATSSARLLLGELWLQQPGPGRDSGWNLTVSGRDFPNLRALGPAAVSQSDPLQPPRSWRSLCGIRATGDLRR